MKTESDQHSDERGQFNFSYERIRSHTVKRSKNTKESGGENRSPSTRKNHLKEFLNDKNALRQVKHSIKLLHDDLMH